LEIYSTTNQIMASHLHFCNHFKQATQKLVPSFYGLVNVPQKDVQDKVALALAKGNYHAKNLWQGMYTMVAKVRFRSDFASIWAKPNDA
jgi:hypothetical protein